MIPSRDIVVDRHPEHPDIPVAWIEVRFLDIAGDSWYSERIPTLPRRDDAPIQSIEDVHLKVLAECKGMSHTKMRVGYEWLYTRREEKKDEA